MGFLGVEDEFLGKKTIGNFGLMDQYAAISWVKNFIHHFGGDKNKITLSGDSAGAESTMSHLLWEDSMKEFNFSGGIPMSLPLSIPYATLEHSENMLENLGEKFNCTTGRLNKEVDIDCLRNQDGQALADANVFSIRTDIRDGYILTVAQPWPPTIDNTIVKKNIYDQIKDQNTYDQLPPILTGTAREEGEVVGSLLIPDYKMTKIEYDLIFSTIVRRVKDNVTSSYPFILEDSEESYDNFVKLVTDYVFYCPNRQIFGRPKTPESNKDKITKGQHSNNFFYVWDRPISIPRVNDPEAYARCTSYACHSDQSQWFFGDYKMMDYYLTKVPEDKRDPRFTDRYAYDALDPATDPETFVSEIDLKLGREYRKFIADFVRYQKINEMSGWMEFDNIDYPVMHVNVDGDIGEMSSYRQDYCDLWDDLDIYTKLF